MTAAGTQESRDPGDGGERPAKAAGSPGLPRGREGAGSRRTAWLPPHPLFTAIRQLGWTGGVLVAVVAVVVSSRWWL